MDLQKTPPNRSKKLTQAANGMSCIKCGKQGKTRACHYNGDRQHMYGKGRSVKCDDFATAEFCQECDEMFSEGTTKYWRNREERSEAFLHYITMTNIRRLRGGRLKVV